MNQLSLKQRAQALHLLVEGNSLRATARIVGIARNTVSKLLCDVGAACMIFQDRIFRNLPCTRLECDEIWSFCYAKARNLSDDLEGRFGYGDIWTWVALCADTKLVPCWHIGYRDIPAACVFIKDLASRLNHRVQLTTDGHKPYLNAVKSYFGEEIDYACIKKLYSHKGSYALCTGTETTTISGDPQKPGTSYIERQNLTMRQHCKRYARATNAYSKKIQNHGFAVALHFCFYNLCRIHSSIKTTPAMAAGITDHVWTLEEIAELANSDTHSKMIQSRPGHNQGETIGSEHNRT